ncbi:MAG TPA: hypothetical protein VFV31_07180 [Chitinophagaceae bacterium]|nr:hypothetical protein [Chitinophagaceae bacterium]
MYIINVIFNHLKQLAMKTLQKPIMLSAATLISAIAFGQLGLGVTSSAQAALNTTVSTTSVVTAANSATSAVTAANTATSVVNAAGTATNASVQATKATVNVAATKVADLRATTVGMAGITTNNAQKVVEGIKDELKGNANLNAGASINSSTAANTGLQIQNGGTSGQIDLGSSATVNSEAGATLNGSKLIDKTEKTAAVIVTTAENNTAAAIQAGKYLKTKVSGEIKSDVQAIQQSAASVNPPQASAGVNAESKTESKISVVKQ